MKNRSKKNPKNAQSTYENGYIKQEKLFGEIQNGFLVDNVEKMITFAVVNNSKRQEHYEILGS